MRGIERDDVERGQVVSKPSSITPHTQASAQVYVLTRDEGGRHTPFFDGYKPQFYIRTTDVTGSAHLPEGTEMVMPGDNVEMRIELITPVAMEEGLRFAIREGRPHRRLRRHHGHHPVAYEYNRPDGVGANARRGSHGEETGQPDRHHHGVHRVP